jgi:predicted nucleic acid-binding protein
LIATHAIAHGVALLTRDADFAAISKAKLGLLLA